MVVENLVVWLAGRFWAAQYAVGAFSKWIWGYLKNVAYFVCTAFMRKLNKLRNRIAGLEKGGK